MRGSSPAIRGELPLWQEGCWPPVVPGVVAGEPWDGHLCHQGEVSALLGGLAGGLAGPALQTRG